MAERAAFYKVMPLASIREIQTRDEMLPLGKRAYNRQHSATPQPGPAVKPSVLLVMTSDGHSRLIGGLAELGIEIVRASNCGQARRVLATSRDVRAVVTDLTLADGNWRAVLEAVAANCVNTEIVVLAPSGNAKLRRHLRESGVYDLLAAPYLHGEVGRIVGGAVLTSYRRHVALSRSRTILARAS